MLRDDVASEAQVLASEVFNRSWQFIECDPVLAGEDRQTLQGQLEQVILEVMSNGERNLWVIANRAIGILRERCAQQRVEETA